MKEMRMLREEEVQEVHEYLQGAEPAPTVETVEVYMKDWLRNKSQLSEVFGEFTEISAKTSVNYKNALKNAVDAYAAKNELPVEELPYLDLKEALLGVIQALPIADGRIHRDVQDLYEHFHWNLWFPVSQLNYNRDIESIQAGMKVGKVLGKLFPQHRDVLNNLFSNVRTSRKEKVYISTRPIDLLSPSDGNSWTSCLNIQKGGCYSNTVTGYLNDVTTLIAYTTNESGAKTWRQLFHVDLKQKRIIAARHYPRIESGLERAVLDYLESKMYNDEERANLKKRTSCDMGEYAERDCDSITYVDVLHYAGQDYKYIYSSALDVDHDDRMVISGESWAFDDDYAILEGEGTHFSNNAHYCNYCDEYVFDGEFIDGHGHICEHCRDEHFRYCDECHTWHHEDNMMWVESEGILICNRCYENEFQYCSHCEEIYRFDETIEDEHYDRYCETCYHDTHTECEECGDSYTTHNMYYDEETEMDYCEDCYNQLLLERSIDLERIIDLERSIDNDDTDNTDGTTSLKVGDRVRVTDAKGYWGYSNGDEGVVKSTYGGITQVLFDNGEEYYVLTFAGHKLEVVK